MKKIVAISEIPNTLDVTELLEVKGGFTISGNTVCIAGSAVKCQGAPAVAVCQPGTSAVTITPDQPTQPDQPAEPTDPVQPPTQPKP